MCVTKLCSFTHHESCSAGQKARSSLSCLSLLGPMFLLTSNTDHESQQLSCLFEKIDNLWITLHHRKLCQVTGYHFPRPTSNPWCKSWKKLVWHCGIILFLVNNKIKKKKSNVDTIQHWTWLNGRKHLSLYSSWSCRIQWTLWEQQEICGCCALEPLEKDLFYSDGWAQQCC